MSGRAEWEIIWLKVLTYRSSSVRSLSHDWEPNIFPSSLPILICQKAFYHMATNFWNKHRWKYSRVKTFPFFLQIRTRNSILWEAQLFISFSLFWVEVHNFNSCSWQMKKSCLSFHNSFKPLHTSPFTLVFYRFVNSRLFGSFYTEK